MRAIRRLASAWLAALVPTVLVLAPAASAHAAEVRCACAEALRPILEELGPRFEQASGHRLVIDYGLAPVLLRRLESGAAFDLAIINPSQVDSLVQQGKLVHETRADLARAGVGVAVRAGAAKPELGSVEAFRATLLAARSVTFPDEGTSGIYFRDLLQRLGLTEQMKDKLMPAGAGAGFGMVARGEAQYMVTIIPQLLANPGIELAGPVPRELQTWIGLTAAVGTGARQPEAAKALIAYLTAPAASALMRLKGWDTISAAVHPDGRVAGISR